MNDQKIETIQQALEYAAAHGVSVTGTDWKRLDEMQQQARQTAADAALDQEHKQGWVERFNAAFPSYLRFMTGLFEVTITTGKTFITGFGVLIGLILLVIVEQSRTKYGILLFEVHTSLAEFGSIALVFFNTALEFTIHHVEHKHGYSEDRAVRNSLRLQLHKFSYWLGWGKDWTPAPLSPAHRYKQYQRLLTATILILATAGSMRDVILSQQGTWYEAAAHIVTQSSLAQIATWLSGLLFAFAAVRGAQIATAYLAIVAREIEENMDHQQTTAANPGEDRAVQYILAKVANKTGQAEQYKTAPEVQVKYSESTGEMEHFLAAAPQPNGNGRNGHH
jgi:hypothetical protein